MKNIEINSLCTNQIEKLCTEGSYINCLENNPSLLNVSGYSDTLSATKECADLKKIRKVLFHSESMNPKEIYHPLEYYVETNIYTLINKLVNNLIEENNDLTFIAGAKGIGKTLTQNIYLKLNDTLLEDNNIFWVRCDCSKLINIVINAINSSGSTTINDIDINIIEDYFDIQFLSVLAKNYKSIHRPFFEKIFEDIKSSTFEIRTSKNPIDPTWSEKSIIEDLEKFHGNFMHFKRTRNDDRFHYGREEIFLSRLKKENRGKIAFEKYRNLSKAIQKILSNNGYKFLKIIDGVDNYKKYDSTGNTNEFYDFLLKRILKFHIEYLTRVKKSNNESVFVFLRQNTVSDYIRVFQKQKYEQINDRPIINYIKTPNNLLVKKQILFKRNEFIKNFQEMGIPELRNFKKITQLFSLIVNDDLSNNTYMNDLIESDKHFGDFLMNNFNLLTALLFFQSKYEISDSHLMNFKNEYIAVNTLLNGNFSLNSHDNKDEVNIENGKILFNIFYYDHHKFDLNKKKWQGLCCTRILQLMSDQVQRKREEIIEEISNLFEYETNQINAKISKLLSFSLLKYEKDDGSIIIATKGKVAMNLIYSNIDILYNCALDSPLPNHLIHKSCISPHSNEPNIRNYKVSCLKTSISFILYLKLIDKMEKNSMRERNIQDNIIQKFVLPFDSEEIQNYLNSRLNYFYSTLRDGTLDDFASFINTHKIDIN